MIDLILFLQDMQTLHLTLLVTATLAGILGIPTMTKYYHLTGSKYFFLLILFFIVFVIHTYSILFLINLPYFDGFLFFVGWMTFVLYVYLFFIIITGFRWDSPPKLMMYFANGMLISSTILILSFIFFEPLRQYVLELQFYVDFFRLFTAILTVYIFLTIQPILKTRRTNFAMKLWLLLGLFLIIPGTTHVGGLGLMFINLLPSSLILPFLEISGTICLSTGSALCIVIVFFPESLLVSKTQIINAAKLYKWVETQKDTPKDEPDEMSTFKKYIMDLPPDLLKNSQ